MNQSKLIEGAKKVLFPQYNQCRLCKAGLPPMQESFLCDECIAQLNDCLMGLESVDSNHPPLAVVVSAYWYQDEAKQLTHMLKYHSGGVAAPLLAHGMCAAFAQAVNPIVREASVIIAVPSHKNSIKRRGYNQAYYLAKEMSVHLDLPIYADVLIKQREVRSQVGQNRAQRMSAFENTFVVQNPGPIDGKHVLLVDDVITTGSTAIACASAMLCAGAAHVSLITACHA